MLMDVGRVIPVMQMTATYVVFTVVMGGKLTRASTSCSAISSR